jgi:hypothetical protein
MGTMAIKVELTPEDESRLTREAEVRGVRPEKYAGDLLQAALAGRVSEKDPEEYDDVLDRIPPPDAKAPALAVEQFHAMLHSLAEGAENLPNLTTESFTRESFYEERNIANDS